MLASIASLFYLPKSPQHIVLPIGVWSNDHVQGHRIDRRIVIDLAMDTIEASSRCESQGIVAIALTPFPSLC
jgi:hypothetical protein